MNTTLRTDITIKDIFDEFIYNVLERKSLVRLSRTWPIHHEYLKNYTFIHGKQNLAIITSVLKGYSLGLIYFYKINTRIFKMLPSFIHITSIKGLTQCCLCKFKMNLQQ